jgi:hypothetical protein
MNAEIPAVPAEVLRLGLAAALDAEAAQVAATALGGDHPRSEVPHRL